MWFIYYLHDAVTGELLYIGRSSNPKRRQAAFHALHHVLTEMGEKQRHSDFASACQAELEAIARHRPPYNKILASSPGATGYKHSMTALVAMSEAAAKPKSEQTRQKMRKPKTEEHKKNMSKPKSPEHRAKLALVLKKATAARLAKRRTT